MRISTVEVIIALRPLATRMDCTSSPPIQLPNICRVPVVQECGLKRYLNSAFAETRPYSGYKAHRLPAVVEDAKIGWFWPTDII